MAKKTTDELYSEITKAKSPEGFIKENGKEFKKDSVPDVLRGYLTKYKVEQNDVVRRSDISTSYGYQIFEGRKNASRDKLLRLALAYPLSVEDTEILLRAGDCSNLYVRNKRDALILFALTKKMNVIETNELLAKNSEAII